MTAQKKTLLAVILLILISLLLTGCVERMRGLKVALDWSRGVQLGWVDVGTTEASIGLAVKPGGDLINLVWPIASGDGGRTLRLLTLDKEGTTLIDRSLERQILFDGDPAQLQLTISSGGDDLFLAWIDASEESPGLYYILLAADGTALTPAGRLSSTGFAVRGYQVAALADGSYLVVWSDRSGILAVRVGQDGQATQPTALVRRGAWQLGFQIDNAGLAHLAWQEAPSPAQRDIYYATLNPDALDFSTPAQLTTERVYEQLYGPVVALEAGEPNQVYVGWTMAIRRTFGGSVVAEHSAFYVSFLQGEAGVLISSRIGISPWFPPVYEPVSSQLAYQQLAAAYPDDWTGVRANFYQTPAPLPGVADQAVWGLAMYARTRWGEEVQPALLVFDEGQVKGYQLAAWTRSPSLQPAIARDADGNLYLAWLETMGRQGTFVYLTSTAPALRKTWDHLTGDDFLVELERFAGRFFAATGLAPAAFAWAVQPVIWIIVALAILRTTSLLETKGRIIFLGAVVLHWSSKYFVTSEVITYLPRPGYAPLILPFLTSLAPSAMLKMATPGALPAWLGFLVPTLVMALSLIILHWVYLRWKDEPSALVAYTVLALIDILISLEIYALAYFDPMAF